MQYQSRSLWKTLPDTSLRRERDEKSKLISLGPQTFGPHLEGCCSVTRPVYFLLNTHPLLSFLAYLSDSCLLSVSLFIACSWTAGSQNPLQVPKRPSQSCSSLVWPEDGGIAPRSTLSLGSWTPGLLSGGIWECSMGTLFGFQSFAALGRTLHGLGKKRGWRGCS